MSFAVSTSCQLDTPWRFYFHTLFYPIRNIWLAHLKPKGRHMAWDGPVRCFHLKCASWAARQRDWGCYSCNQPSRKVLSRLFPVKEHLSGSCSHVHSHLIPVPPPTQFSNPPSCCFSELPIIASQFPLLFLFYFACELVDWGFFICSLLAVVFLCLFLFYFVFA